MIKSNEEVAYIITQETYLSKFQTKINQLLLISFLN